MVGSSIRILTAWLCCATLAISVSACTRSAKLQVGDEARRLNESATREQLPENNNATKASAGNFARRETITIHQSIALVVAAEHQRRSRAIERRLKNAALGKVPYENLQLVAKRWSELGGGASASVGQNPHKQRIENLWWITNLALAYTRVNDKSKNIEKVAAEALLLEAVAEFWARLNAQRFSPIINQTRRALQESLKLTNLSPRERRSLRLLERQLFKKTSQIASKKIARGGGSKSLRNKARGATLLPPPEILSVTYTPELFDRIVTSKIPIVRLGAKRSDRKIPRLTSLLETLNTMPYLGIFAVQPSDVRPFYGKADEDLLMKITEDVAWSLIDLQYRKKNLDKQNYSQSKNVLVGATRMLAARIAVGAYDAALQQFSDALWRFQRQEKILLQTKLANKDDPRSRDFLQTYSIHLISAIDASQAYAESLNWSIRLAFLSQYLKAPEVRQAKNSEQIIRNAEKIEARLRQTPGLIHTRLEGSNPRLVFGLPANRRQALDQIIEAGVAIQANKRRAKTNAYGTLPAMIQPDGSGENLGENLFEQGSSIYPQLPRPSQEKNSPKLRIPQRLQ